MMVNYNNCLFIISSVLGVVCAAPVEDSPPVQDEVAKVEEYSQYPVNTGFNPAFAYGVPLLPPPRTIGSGAYYIVDLVRPTERNPTETNEINQGYEDGAISVFHHDDDQHRNYGQDGDRKKRDVSELEKDLKDGNIPEESKVGKLRQKRTYCKKCGGGGYGYRPQIVAYRPTYYPSYGGGGCNVCGGGRPQGGYGGYGGGGGGSYSQSSAQSSSSSWGYGKK